MEKNEVYRFPISAKLRYQAHDTALMHKEIRKLECPIQRDKIMNEIQNNKHNSVL